MAIAMQHPQDIFRDIPQSRNAEDYSLATQPQINFVCDLFRTRDLFKDPRFFDMVNAMDEDEYRQYLDHLRRQLPAMPKKNASQLIDSLKELPKREIQRADASSSDDPWTVRFERDEKGEVIQSTLRLAPAEIENIHEHVPRGSYAIHTPNREGNPITFLSLWIKDDGSRWSLKMYSSDELLPLRRAQQYAYLELIGADPEAAAKLYGLERKRCGICHRKLTRIESRERGIGPICAERWGWSF